MKKLLLLKLSLVALLVAGFEKANAQFSSVLDIRLIVDEPAAIAGVKRFTFSSDGTTPWGRAIDSIWIREEVVEAGPDPKACQSINSVTDKWILINRGDCEFGQKAARAQNAGAKGVIIWNHTEHELVNMAGGTAGGNVGIPVLFVTKADGEAMVNQLKNGERVFISLTRWGFNKTHDLSFVGASGAMPPNGAMPFNQFDGTDVPAYRMYTGAFVANTGTSTETNVKVVQEGTFTPTGGSATTILNDTTNVVASFPTIDSIVDLFSANTVKLSPTGTGKYNFTYKILADATDESQFDNTMTTSMDITTNMFCKSNLDANGVPVSSTWPKLSAAGTELTWGPLFYNRKGGFAMENIGLSLNDGDTSKHSLDGVNNDFIDVYVFKWVDANSDKYMQSGELSLKSIAIKTFTNADSNKMFFYARCGDAETGKPASIATEDDSWYWVAANLSSVFGLGCDSRLSYYNRANAAQNFAANKVNDFWSPAVSTNVNTIRSSTGDTIRMMPFNVTPVGSIFVDSAAYTTQLGTVPSVALYTGFPVSVSETKAVNTELTVFPNPAKDNINININLDKTADKLFVKVIDAFGRNVHMESLTNVKNNKLSLSTAAYPAGNYYVVMINGETAVSKQFTVVR